MTKKRKLSSHSKEKSVLSSNGESSLRNINSKPIYSKFSHKQTGQGKSVSTDNHLQIDMKFHVKKMSHALEKLQASSKDFSNSLIPFGEQESQVSYSNNNKLGN